MSSDGTERDGAAIVGQVVEDNGVLTASAGENGTTYESFFDVTLAEENYDLWYDCTAAIVGESAAEDTVAFMQGYISSEMYGEDAIAYYADNPDAQTVFDCFFINGLTIDENGHGITMMNGEQTTDFEAYAYDNGEKDDGAGIYIAYSNLESEAEAAAYTLETDDAGEEVLTLYAKDGVISYKQAS